MIDVRDIHSLSSFQRSTREHMRRLKETRRPEVLTVNGKAEVIVQDASAYQDLVDALGKREQAPRTRSAPTPTPDLEPDPVVEAYKAHVDRTLLRENLSRTVEERMANLVALQRLAAEARAGGASENAK